jgi:hypothetical protein
VSQNPHPRPHAPPTASARRVRGRWSTTAVRFKALFGRVTEAQTALERRALTGSSGTGGLEAAVVNQLSPAIPCFREHRRSATDRVHRHDPRRGCDQAGDGATPPSRTRCVTPSRDAGRAAPPRRCSSPSTRRSTGVTNPADSRPRSTNRMRSHRGRRSGIGAPLPHRAWASTSRSPPRRRDDRPASPWSRSRCAPGRPPNGHRSLLLRPQAPPDAGVKVRPPGPGPWASISSWTSRSSSSRPRLPGHPLATLPAAPRRAGLAAMGFQLFADQAYVQHRHLGASAEGVEWSA